MTENCRLSRNAEIYLETFDSILNEMIKKMSAAELMDSVSHNFIVQMIPHHRAAIEMSKNILTYTTSITVQNIAEQIIDEQTQSIDDMKKILGRCSKRPDCEYNICSYQRKMDHIMNAMFHEMGNTCATNQLNANFMREMIPHHIGAIRMANTTLEYPICPELKPMLYAIISSQQREVRQMQRLLRCAQGI